MINIGTAPNSGGAGYFTGIEDPSTGVIDGTTKIFTFVHSPKELISDGVTYLPTKGYAVTGTGPYTATLDIAPTWMLTSIY